MERADRDAGHVLRTDLHLGQEAVDQVNGREQDVVRQFVPDLEAAQHVRCAVACTNGDLAILCVCVRFRFYVIKGEESRKTNNN